MKQLLLIYWYHDEQSEVRRLTGRIWDHRSHQKIELENHAHLGKIKEFIVRFGIQKFHHSNISPKNIYKLP